CSIFRYGQPRPPRSTLFPYTTLFRSRRVVPRRTALPSNPTGRQWPGEIIQTANSGMVLSGPSAPLQLRSADWGRVAGRLLSQQRSEEHTSELQSPYDLVCRLRLEKKE